MFRFSRICAQADDLRRALTDPMLPVEAQQSVVDDLLEGKASDATQLLVRGLISRGRAHDLDRALAGLARDGRRTARQHRRRGR